ncbi:large-conductance mechanosensitive channel protein MscL [Paenibacillus sp. FSL W8-0186]|uniref:Large-conductance mechanosensitive channel n=1 Tax=Paenibacillus woosongensis TaxID=307580 RepID=A0A7X3CMJ2_9BACL|nr:large-conductance mechanosensitive channel protein MscL [Paenibacillus woosongensis]MUG45703.1 large-conductance mechanosensitive channel protein MscL [Paenibacillus woosongensis]GIP56400.1 large-conductance mechanosensitive channel [Paenibacillus woosongensis]
MWKEFKTFAFKGNVLDLAIAVIIGGAFGKIVSSVVEDLIMPLLGILLGGRDFSNIVIQVNEATIKIGSFMQTVIDFLIIAFSIFLFTKLLSKFKRKDDPKPDKPAEPSKEELLLTEIRDLLKNKQL